ncbi:MAG: XdhC/CoxI family protein [Bacillota bacterium]|nr:XdhC/CoxI family protein [Bacillota bacterium]
MNIIEEILKAQKLKKHFAVVTIVETEGSTPRNENAKMLVFSDGRCQGTIGGGVLENQAIQEAQEAIKRRKSTLVKYRLHEGEGESLPMKCGGNVQLFIEVFTPKPALVIVGAGHVGKALSEVAKMLNFEITIIDDREEWADKDRFPGGTNVLVKKDMTKAFDNIEIDVDTCIVIATRGHGYDKEALSAALKLKASYIGMIGSNKKVRETFQQLINEGFDAELLKKVYSPIGLDLGAETPEEIAVSIMAEILKVRNNAKGGSLSEGTNYEFIR